MSALCAVGVFHGVSLFSDIFQLLFYWFSLYVYCKYTYLFSLSFSNSIVIRKLVVLSL